LQPPVIGYEQFSPNSYMKKIQDHYFKKAKKEGYAARSVYKLQEAQEKYHFIRPGHAVLDLGAYPGSWTKYAAKVVGPDGLVVSVDVQKLGTNAANVVTLCAYVFELSASRLSELSQHFDVVLSDMAPKTTGRKDVDHLKSIDLADRARSLAMELLRKQGTFFCKVFQGEAFPRFLNECRGDFRTVKVVKPSSSRSESVETFLLCTGPRNHRMQPD
jgi:23S rRNA (uridine2552-2'-O)-methyltransferase